MRKATIDYAQSIDEENGCVISKLIFKLTFGVLAKLSRLSMSVCSHANVSSVGLVAIFLGSILGVGVFDWATSLLACYKNQYYFI